MFKSLKTLKNLKSGEGFSIVEALVSIVLLAITMTAGMAFFINSSKVGNLALHKKNALENLVSRLEFLKANALTEAGYNALQTDPFAATVKIGSLSADANEALLTGSRMITVTSFTSPTYKQVHGRVSWTEADRNTPFNVELTTYIAP